MRIIRLLRTSFLCLLLSLAALCTNACTTFLLNKNGHLVFGRNYDWVTGNGFIATNLKGLKKTSFDMKDGPLISWTSKYGSITFNQYGKEFPNGGMNEKGLVVELMWLEETKFEKPDSRPALNVLQWIQYQLDNHASVAEVIASIKKLRISSGGGIPLHYLVADASGKAAAIEILNGKVIVHEDTQLPVAVLTNNTYTDSEKYRKKKSEGSTRSPAFTSNSLDRYTTACSMVSKFQADNDNRSAIDQSFDILAAVKQGSFTKWSISYDITDRKIYFKTSNNSSVRSVGLDAVSVDCMQPSLVYDLSAPGEGDISKRLKGFNQQDNQQLVLRSLQESSAHVKLPKILVDQLVMYPEQVGCQIMNAK